MEKQTSIKKNMVMNIILTGSNFIFPFISYAYVSRVLLPAGTGKVAFVQSILAYFVYISTLGVYGYCLREAARVRDDREKLSLFVQEILGINLVAIVVSLAGLFATVVLVPKLRQYSSLFLVMSISVVLEPLGIEWLYAALEKFSYITIRSILVKVLSLVLMIIFIKDEGDYVIYGGLLVFSTSANYLMNLVHARKYITFRRFPAYHFRKHLKFISVFFFTFIITSIYGHFDTIMLGFMKGNEDVGIYSAAMKMKGIVLSVSTAVTSVLVPRMAVYFAKDDVGGFRSLAVKSVRVSMLLLLPLSLFVFINAGDVIEFVCGKEFLPAVSTLRILMICTLFLTFTNLFGNQILIPKGKEKVYSTSVFIGLFINIILNTLLIPRYSSAGAAFATLVTEGFNVCWMGAGCLEEIRYMRKNLKFRTYLLSAVTALLLEEIVIHLSSGLPLFWRLVVNTLGLFLTYYAMNFLLREPLVSNAVSSMRTKISSHLYE